jgi:hypothetical protein
VRAKSACVPSPLCKSLHSSGEASCTATPNFPSGRRHRCNRRGRLRRQWRYGKRRPGNQQGQDFTQAVTVAEQHANGKASRAEYENSKQGWVYDVEVVSGAKVFDVRVDADKGTVISSAEDKADHDDDHDKRD